MGIGDVLKEWLISVALKKAIKKIILVGVAWIATQQLTKYGVNVSIDPDTLEKVLFAGSVGGLEIARNFIKTKTGLGWL